MSVDVWTCPHPFRAERVHRTVDPGASIEEIVQSVQPDPFLRRHALVSVGEAIIPREYWSRVRPREGALVNVRVVPGDNDKDPLRTILTIAVVWASAGVAGGGLSSITGTGVGAYAAGAAVSMLGRLAIDAIAPPDTPGGGGGGFEQDRDRPDIQNARNRLIPYGVIPRTFGTDRVFPPKSAPEFTTLRGGDVFLFVAVTWGYGPLQIDDLKIGDTPIHDFDDIEVSTDKGDGNGFDNGDRFSRDIDELPLAITLTESGGFSQRTTEADTDRITVELTFPEGLFKITKRGKKRSVNIKVQIDYAETGTNNWKSIATDASAGTAGSSPGNATSIGSGSVSVPEETSMSTGPSQAATYRRTDLVYVDRARETVKLEKGTASYFGDGQRPRVPSGGIPLAHVVMKSSLNGKGPRGSIIRVDEIESVNNLARPSDVFDSGSDFQCSKGGALTVDFTSGKIIVVDADITGKRTSVVRKRFNWSVDRGQYDVRVKRVTEDSNSDRVRDKMVWTRLRSVKNTAAVTKSGIAQTHIVAKATDQLQGAIDRVNARVTSILPDYDAASDTWITRPTQNPASHLREIWQGAANDGAVGDSRINLDDLESFHQFCEDNKFYFNHTFERGTTVARATQKVLSVARASRSVVDGVWSVVWDHPNKSVVQTFSEKTMRPGFTGSKRFTREPHALRVEFRNAEQGFQTDERIVYDDGFNSGNATVFEGTRVDGIIYPEQAYSYGRYQMAVNRLRPEVYELPVDLMHLVATRGDMIRFRHDVPLWGLGSGRVKSIQTSGGNTTGVTVDETLTLEAAKDYAMRFSFVGGGDLLRDLAGVVSDTETSTVTFDNPIASGSGPQPGDLFLFGEQDSESVNLLIKSIGRSDADGNVTLTCVDEAPAIHTADSEIPEFNTQMTVQDPLSLNRPAFPEIEEIQTDEDVLVADGAGGLQPRIVITYRVEPGDGPAITDVQVRYRDIEENVGYRYVNAPVAATQISIDDVETGDVYDVEMRSLTEFGVTSGWRKVDPALRVIGSSSDPADIEGLTIQAVSSLAVLRWDRHEDIDVRVGGHIEFRHSRSTSGATWENSVQIGESVDGNATEAVLPLKKGTYLARPRDAGNRLGNVATVSTAAATAVAFTQIDTLQEHPLFPGTHSNTVLDSTRATPAVKLAGVGLFDDIADFDAISSLDEYGGVQESGTYTFDTGFDLGSVKNVQIETELDVVIGNVQDKLDDRTDPIDEWEDFDGNAGADANAAVFVRTTEDDPNGSPTWSDYERVEVGEYSARGMEFQCRLSANDPAYNIFVEHLAVNVKETA